MNRQSRPTAITLPPAEEVATYYPSSASSTTSMRLLTPFTPSSTDKDGIYYHEHASATYTFPHIPRRGPTSRPPPQLSPAEQECLPSWRRDFDKMTDPTMKDRWAKELYRDFCARRIPVTGDLSDDVVDWESCVKKVNGVKDARETAKALVAAQERKAELQGVRMMKEPPRRQNKFICYRSLRSTQLAGYFTTFKQSQFSAITSLEWKDMDTDWWGDVADLVEVVRRQKYLGQLDHKGNSVRRMSEKKPKPTKRYDPYTRRASVADAAAYPTPNDSPFTAPVHRHSIDMGNMAEALPHEYPYPVTPVDSRRGSVLGLYTDGTCFPTLTTIPQSPVIITPHTTYTPPGAFNNPFAYSTEQINPDAYFPTATPQTSYSCLPVTSYFELSPGHPPIDQAQVYAPQQYAGHIRGTTHELMQRYTQAQDFVPEQSQSYGEWTSQYPSLAY